MSLAVFAWTWVSTAAPEWLIPLTSRVVSAWCWSVDRRLGLFSAGGEGTGEGKGRRREREGDGRAWPCSRPEVRGRGRCKGGGGRRGQQGMDRRMGLFSAGVRGTRGRQGGGGGRGEREGTVYICIFPQWILSFVSFPANMHCRCPSATFPTHSPSEPPQVLVVRVRRRCCRGCSATICG